MSRFHRLAVRCLTKSHVSATCQTVGTLIHSRLARAHSTTLKNARMSTPYPFAHIRHPNCSLAKLRRGRLCISRGPASVAAAIAQHRQPQNSSRGGGPDRDLVECRAKEWESRPRHLPMQRSVAPRCMKEGRTMTLPVECFEAHP